MNTENEFKKRHSESHFYKYARASTARHILKEGKFLAQSPLKFNDPFDVQIGMHLDFDPSNMHNLLHEKLISIVESKNEPVFEQRTPFSEFAVKLRKAAKDGPLLNEKIKEETKPLYDTLGEKLRQDRVNYIENRMKFIKRMRTLCFTTTPDNMLMWSHYAKDHTGVVIKLKVAENESDDDPLWLAEKVVYTKKAAPLIPKDTMVDLTFGLIKTPPKHSGRELGLIKYDVWEYENEFRLWDVVNETNVDPYTIQIHPKRFEAVYFGVKTDEKEAEEIRNLALELNKDMKIFRAKKHESEFKIVFDQI